MEIVDGHGERDASAMRRWLVMKRRSWTVLGRAVVLCRC